MINLISKTLPNVVTVGGGVFSIYTDFRKWMRFCIEYEEWDRNGKKDIFDFGYLFKNSIPTFYSLEDMTPLIEFAYPQNVLPRGESSGERVLDYAIDSDYIYSAFYQQYGIDLTEVEELHWHKFRALFNGLTDATKLIEIIGYRCYTGEKVKDQEEICRRLKDSWELPRVETEEEKEAQDRFNEMFG